METFNNTFYIKSAIALKLAFPKAAPERSDGRDFYSISFRLCGTTTVETDRVVTATKNTLLYVPKHTAYRTEIIDESAAYIIHFTAQGELPDKPMVIQVADTKKYQLLFEKILLRFSEGDKDLKAIGYTYQILSSIQDEYRENKVCSDRAKQAKAFIDENYYDDNLSIKNLADLFGVSETYFRKEFKKSFNITPNAYIQSVRLSYAEAMMQAGLHSISDIAIKSGYNSIAYFSHSFRKYYGLTPSEYLRSLIKKE